ncbi:hypothetical protein N658DRAFT_510974 [Parathielavia hyrcaniae]|uniref:Uncharacterized protein n=1 Tax=Parathielavia hyrcaniae TaxID=113614 RepID=A0AAN6SXT0_9PEZI|nr:hypothetical protein N658DRAFT_510974 [Parathielavia hyrcaniae]
MEGHPDQLAAGINRPPVHFKIFHERFVRRTQWIDEQVFQELFSVASLNLLSCITLIRDGLTLEHSNRVRTAHHPRLAPTLLSLPLGTLIIASLLTFLITTTLRSTIPASPFFYRLFAIMYLTGTILFGSGPVVIPLLHVYVVAEG